MCIYTQWYTLPHRYDLITGSPIGVVSMEAQGCSVVTLNDDQQEVCPEEGVTSDGSEVCMVLVLYACCMLVVCLLYACCMLVYSCAYILYAHVLTYAYICSYAHMLICSYLCAVTQEKENTQAHTHTHTHTQVAYLSLVDEHTNEERERIGRNKQGGFFRIYQPNKWRRKQREATQDTPNLATAQGEGAYNVA